MQTSKTVRTNAVEGVKATETKAAIYEGCLAADSYWKIPVNAGQRYIIDARIDAGCDSRGWSCDNWATRSGPEGVPGYYVGGSLGYPNAPIGMLIGAITQFDAGPSLDHGEAIRVFSNNNLLVGTHYESTSPINGFLYLIFNDTWSGADNKGSVHVRVTYL